MEVNVQGISPARILAILYNGVKNREFLMTEEYAEELLKRYHVRQRYWHIDFISEVFIGVKIFPMHNWIDVTEYDKKNGKGTAERLIRNLQFNGGVVYRD